MCYSAQVSIDTFLLTLFASYFLFREKHSAWSLAFWFSFTLVQLMEFFLWTYLRHPEYNKFFSLMVMFLICSQPFFAIMKSSLSNKAWFIGLYSLVVVSIVTSTPLQRIKTSVAPNKHLLWEWAQFPSWIVFLWCVFLIIPLFASNQGAGLITLITLLISIYTFYKDGTWASMWCWMATISSFFIIYDGIFSITQCT